MHLCKLSIQRLNLDPRHTEMDTKRQLSGSLTETRGRATNPTRPGGLESLSPGRSHNHCPRLFCLAWLLRRSVFDLVDSGRSGGRGWERTRRGDWRVTNGTLIQKALWLCREFWGRVPREVCARTPRLPETSRPPPATRCLTTRPQERRGRWGGVALSSEQRHRYMNERGFSVGFPLLFYRKPGRFLPHTMQ